MHITVQGQGPDLVMLHGWSMNSDVWHELADLLSQSYTLHLVDLPGHGQSDWQQGDFVLEKLISQLQQQVPKTAFYLGWSLGGLIAALFSYHYPQQVKKLIMVAASPCFTQRQDWPCAMDEQVFKGFAENLAEQQEETLHRFLLLQARGSQHSKQTIRQLSERVGNKMPQSEALKSGLDALITSDVRPQFSQLSMPVKLILGERDTLIPSTMVNEVQRLNPKMDTTLISGAGHAPFISHPQQCLSEIQQFLDVEKNDE